MIQVFLQQSLITVVRSRKYTDVEMLELLRSGLRRHGQFGGILIDETAGLPSSASNRRRFGRPVS